ncbi:MAG TPA: hypothetical protein VFN44_20025 [Solirubrobacteraceae bacterium]|nr:hypothetical protein [Solirubrobacteraceae bacterium]
MAIASVDGGLLFQVVWSSLLAGVFVTVLFSFVVVFSSRSAEARRTGRGGSGVVYAALAIAAMTVFAFVVAWGVHIMLTKS